MQRRRNRPGHHSRSRQEGAAARRTCIDSCSTRRCTCSPTARSPRNAGAMTPGVTAETVDGMTLAKIERIIELLRQETYRWTPVRRIHIPKKNGTTAPARHPDVVGQAAARGDPPHPGGVLRAAVQRPLPRLSARTRVPHGLARDPPDVDRARPGSSRATSRDASTTSITRSCWASWASASTTTASCG